MRKCYHKSLPISYQREIVKKIFFNKYNFKNDENYNVTTSIWDLEVCLSLYAVNTYCHFTVQIRDFAKWWVSQFLEMIVSFSKLPTIKVKDVFLAIETYVLLTNSF